MKALSVRAPWWWAILHLGKDIENRDWPTGFRGTIYLHASKHWSRREIEEDAYDIRNICNSETGVIPFDEVLPGCGCIVGSVEIVDCVSESRSPWFFGRYGFVLAHPIAYRKPIPFKGALGFFEVPDALLSAVAREDAK